MVHPKRPFDRLDELPPGPGVYIVWSLLSKLSGRPLYIGKTIRDVKIRIDEHKRLDLERVAIPIIKSQAEVEFRQTNTRKQAFALEKELQDKLNPWFGWGNRK